MNFQAIRNARKAAGVTQEQLAEVLGINRATLSKYETGVIEPSVSQLKTIAAALRIDFYVLAAARIPILILRVGVGGLLLGVLVHSFFAHGLPPFYAQSGLI